MIVDVRTFQQNGAPSAYIGQATLSRADDVARVETRRCSGFGARTKERAAQEGDCESEIDACAFYREPSLCPLRRVRSSLVHAAPL